MTARFLRTTRVTSAITALVLAAGCGSLDIANPNAPDTQRAIADPNTIAAIAGGTLATWFNSTQEGGTGGMAAVLADSYTASWNNYNWRYYSSEPRDGWVNDPNSPQYLEWPQNWYAMYSMLSSANDALAAIKRGVLPATDPQTPVVKTIATLAQGLALGEVALNYDQGFVLDETTDLATLTLQNRAAVRDAALAKYDAAIALAGAMSGSTPPAWTGKPAGPSYTGAQLAAIANTYAAALIAQYPRNSAENTAANWTKVLSYASKGISTVGGGFDFNFTQDGSGSGFYDDVKGWSNDITSMRVDTRVAHMMASNQVTPWPDPNGNPLPNSPDNRMLDGISGTDFRWDPTPIFRSSRGQYHQSNIGHVRYEYASFNDPAGTGGGAGTVPVQTRAGNDLLWAEALIRTNGDKALAATLINKTRVGRGGLPPAAAGDADLLTKLQYEQEVELMALGSQVFYNRRRIDGLQARTPRHKPVPGKDLLLLSLELYSFGGANNTNGMAPMYNGQPVQSVTQIWNEMWAHSREVNGKGKRF